MKIYVDFDGVIMDTETHLFDDYEKLLKQGIVKNSREYVEILDWGKHLQRSEIIKNSLDILNRVKLDVTILGKVCSLKEKEEKLKLLRDHNYNKKAIFLPFECKKTDIVNALGNILIDDTVHNLEDWEKDYGIPIYFNKDDKKIDPWGNKNNKYVMVHSLELLYRFEEKGIK